MAGLDWLGDLLGLNKGKATIAAAQKNEGLLSDLEGKIGGLIDANPADDYLKKSLAISDLGPGADGILRDIYGLGGDEGTARVHDTFRTSPGYEFNMEQGLGALERRAAAQGRLQSGETGLDTLRFSQGLADNEFDDWVAGLTSGIDREIGTMGDLATHADATTGQRINLAGDIGSGRLGVNQQVAAGKEAGQGSLIDLFGNLVSGAGALTGLNPFGKPTAPATGPLPGGVPALAGGGFGGYGRGF